MYSGTHFFVRELWILARSERYSTGGVAIKENVTQVHPYLFEWEAFAGFKPLEISLLGGAVFLITWTNVKKERGGRMKLEKKIITITTSHTGCVSCGVSSDFFEGGIFDNS